MATRSNYLQRGYTPLVCWEPPEETPPPQDIAFLHDRADQLFRAVYSAICTALQTFRTAPTNALLIHRPRLGISSTSPQHDVSFNMEVNNTMTRLYGPHRVDRIVGTAAIAGSRMIKRSSTNEANMEEQRPA